MQSKTQRNSQGTLVTRTVLQVAAKLRLELAVLLVRLFESLDRIVGGDEQSARSWSRSRNAVRGGTPIERIQTISCLTDTIAYLETRLARG